MKRVDVRDGRPATVIESLVIWAILVVFLAPWAVIAWWLA